jgi:hypothetical protein
MFASRTSLFLPMALLILAVSSGCSGESENPPQEAAKPAGGEMATPSAPQGTFVGTVLETVDASDYTYVHLEKNGETVWAAGPKTKVQTGEVIGVSLAMPMPNFRSESLDRTFDTVYFVGDFDRTGGQAAGGMSSGSQDPHAGLDLSNSDPDAAARTSAPSTDLSLEGITKPDGGRTIAEVWTARASLAGSPVAVRGRVVKYNSGIMGRNWLHIQDGSGDPAKSTHDITVTSEASTKVGDLVTVRGVLATDKDFGAGYAYDAIIEDASLQVESGAGH